MNTFSAPLLLLVLLPADDKPTPKFPLGKATTYITEPLDKDGYLDYEAALNDRLGKGITPEKNANVLIWKALGPRPGGGKGMPAEFFKRMGVDEPPEKSGYFIGLREYLKDNLNLDESEFEAILDQQSSATQRPWAPIDYPYIAAWLKDNEKPLALVIEATKKSDYYNPFVAARNEKGQASFLISATVPGTQMCRDVANALAARAMLRLEEGKTEEAWRDLLACHRLGRLLGRCGILVEALVALAIDKEASTAELAYLDRAKLTAKQIKACLKDLQDLPPMPPLADKVDLGERLVFLDSAQSIRRDMSREFKKGGLFGERLDKEVQKAMGVINWDIALENGNRWFDRMVAAMRAKDRAAREKEIDQIDADHKALRKEIQKVGDSAYLMRGKNDPKEAGKVMGDVLIRLFLPATRQIQDRNDQAAQIQRNLHLAFALAAYHCDNGRYPDKLDDLAPKYSPAIPDDLFSGKPLIYRSTEKGYLFYSVGPNSKDDEGRWRDDDPPGDDIGVRMPLPERKKK
jgi:hypothetical protein